MTTPSEKPPVNTENEYVLQSGQNMPNHTMAMRGLGKYIQTGVHQRPLFRTRQSAYRFAGYLLTMAELLPNEEGEHSFEEVLEAIRNPE